MNTLRELKRPKVGRMARLKGTVEQIMPAPDRLAAPVDRPAAEASPKAPATVAAADRPSTGDIPDPRATLERIRRESAARLERNGAMRSSGNGARKHVGTYPLSTTTKTERRTRQGVARRLILW